MRRVIFNADDFGLTEGVNRGILDCHLRGVVTSTSLMVLGTAADHAAALVREHPELSVGLHFDEAAGALERQLEEFERLLGRLPTHLDSHHHVHREPARLSAFRAAAAQLGVPLRGNGSVAYVGGFYAQWEWNRTNLEYVSREFLERLLAEEVGEGCTEISCHPGYVTPELDSVYASEREAEVRTLTDARIRQTLGRLQIELTTFAHHG
jgi:predicted glycoside hydrolase/deacetylase ChbG (UPF0249 family)